MSGTSSGGAHGAPQRPNELMTILHYVLTYQVRIAGTIDGSLVQGRQPDDPLPRETVVAAMHELRRRAFEVMDAQDRREQAEPVTKSGLSVEHITRLVNAIDQRCDYSIWIAIGIALHYEFSGSVVGFLIWRDWSSQGDVLATMMARWKSFSAFKGPYTAAWLLAHSPAGRG